MNDERWVERLLEACRRATENVQNAPGENGDMIVQLEAVCSRLERRLERVRAKRG